MPNHNTTTQSRIDGLQAALRAIVAECCGPARPYSDDSYLPAHFLEAALAALEGAPTDDAGNWQQYRLDASETAAQIIERERAAYANLLQSVHDERRSKASAPVADEPPGGTRWPVLRAMARNYTAGKHTWDALDANACEQAAEEIRHLRAALASAPVANDVTPAGMKEICPECGHQFGCFHSPYIDKLRAQASATVAGEVVTDEMVQAGAKAARAKASPEDLP